ncbi:MAG: hypothetical protein IT377_13320 [Polyangiaceae bacterium]|nr:hypothetical protein [Polyangiaceae bacterium]
MSESPERIVLSGELTDAAYAEELSAKLRAGTCELDWSAVTRVTDHFADALVYGLRVEDAADAIGATTMRGDVADVINAAFERAPYSRKPRAKAQPKPVPADDVAVWTAPAEPEPASRRSPSSPASKRSPRRAPVLVADVPLPEKLRALLEERVIADLLGPAGGPEEEIVEGSVRDRYLVGMLAPRRVRIEPEQVDGVEAEEGSGSDDGTSDASTVSAPTMFPSAIGLSFVVGTGAPPLRVTARWGRYQRLPSETVTTETGKPRLVWKRSQVEEEVLIDSIREGALGPFRIGGDPDDVEAPVQIRGIARQVGDGFVVSLFLLNHQDEPEERRDVAWLFQPELSVVATDGSSPFLSRNLDQLPSAEHDPLAEDRTLAMLYRDHCELAVGHGVAVHVEVDPAEPRRGKRVATRVVPASDVLQQTPPTTLEEPPLAEVVHDMKVLAESTPAELVERLRKLPDAYAAWIARQRDRIADRGARLQGFEDDANTALDRCELALRRMKEGLETLEKDPKANEAFRFANRAMWLQRVRTVFAEERRRGKDTKIGDVDIPDNRTWRTFQLAFILVSLASVTRLDHPDRNHATDAIADLLWFPTGGGKTEAYLGLAAYTLGLRRLQGTVEGRASEHGVAVLMRYTLRLLTLQQFQRAAALICACELIRAEAEQGGNPIWGREPFRIGLWVGARSTPNKTEHAAEVLKRTRDVGFRQGSRVGGMGSPVQLKSCPWCGSAIEPGRHMRVESFASGAGRTLTYCGDKLGTCPFSQRQSPNEGLPVLVVDEEIYRRLPSLLIATVDKFAQMPWNGAVQMLFGRVQSRCDRHGFAAPELGDSDHKRRGAFPATKLRDHDPVRPPDLIIQDELHLISGPLGTLTGLYETAVDSLCTWTVNGQVVRPKVIASTATIRRAREQIHSLFLRNVQVFPPHGLDAGDNFFARQRPTSELPGRRYVGICAPGRRLKVVIKRVYVAFLAASESLYQTYGKHADPWMTLVGYFSSLRELAGTRRLVDDDISNHVKKMDRRGLASRFLWSPEELTSRLDSTQIPELLDRLEIPFDPAAEDDRSRRRPIDVLLATNMVSVGVDVKRLGLMVVSGQPKNTAEYIQATSRVGRSSPGLVCTIFNWARPRDLSHYETFEHYHETFYNQVEALSVTPFAVRALDRGLSAVLVSLLRLTDDRLNPNEAAARLTRDDSAVTAALDAIVARAAMVENSQEVGEAVRRLLERRLDEWLADAQPRPGGATLSYKAKRDGTSRPLLKPSGTGAPWETFTCLSSLRDVEPSVDLVLAEGNLDDDTRPFTRKSS